MSLMFWANLTGLSMGLRRTGKPKAAVVVDAASDRIQSLERTLRRVDRLLSTQGRQTDDGYYFRGLLDPELGELATTVREALAGLEA